MTWNELNWFAFEGSVFVKELKDTFTTIFTITESEFQQNRKQRDEEIASNTNNEYEGEELSWSEERLQTERQILTTMVFTVTFRAIQNFLNELLYWSTKRKTDFERLDHLEAEFEKIGVVLLNQKEFGIIKELRIARNSCVHNSNKPDREYEKDYPKPRWVDDSGNITITTSQWHELVGQLEHWTHELAERMTKAQKSAVAKEEKRNA